MTPPKKDQKDMEAALRKNMERIGKKILVLSNKGGVGKSSVAASTALILNCLGKRVGVLDADIHGPSLVKMMGQEGRIPSADSEGMDPLEVKPGLKLMSMAAVLGDADLPVIWRGPMKMRALQQFLAEVRWGELDYLVIDSPPGTGDEPLSVCQLIPELAGAVIVTTPQDIALLDSRKCVSFLRQLKVPILGIIENMSGLNCPHCGKGIELFKSGGGEKAARELGVPLLAVVPFDLRMMAAADRGDSFILAHPDAEAARALQGAVGAILRTTEGGDGAEARSPSDESYRLEKAQGVYSDRVLEHWRHPRNFKRMEAADARARITGPCGDTMEIYLDLNGGRIREASFFTDGCIPTIACGSAIVELVTGKDIREALRVGQQTVLEALGGLPEMRWHCALLAANTLQGALRLAEVAPKEGVL